jgi:DNA-binding transcriptional regulator YdaS (Cro superfamily)
VLSPQEGTEELTPAQLKRELRRIAWGHAQLAKKLGVWPTEVREWLTGKEPVPEVVASDIRNLPSGHFKASR